MSSYRSIIDRAYAAGEQRRWFSESVEIFKFQPYEERDLFGSKRHVTVTSFMMLPSPEQVDRANRRDHMGDMEMRSWKGRKYAQFPMRILALNPAIRQQTDNGFVIGPSIETALIKLLEVMRGREMQPLLIGEVSGALIDFINSAKEESGMRFFEFGPTSRPEHTYDDRLLFRSGTDVPTEFAIRYLERLEG